MKKGKFILFTAWIGAIVLLVYITTLNQSKVDKFMGLTANKEHIINFPYPVQLEKVHVLPGQIVKKGELLAELVRADLISKTNILNSKIDELKAKILTEIGTINSDIQNLNIKHQVEINRLNMQIKQSKLELKTNKRLLQAIAGNDNGSFSTLSYKIKSLQQAKYSAETIYLNQKEHLNKLLEHVNAPFVAQLDKLLEEKKILNAKEDRLTVYAQMDGKIGPLSHSENSQIKPFDPLFTIYSKYPEFVTGYIHEDIINELSVGQRVAITSSNKTDSSKTLTYGTIKSIENRIDEIPAKLKRYKIVPLWGYKVFISIPENNLQLGKKVMITTKIKKSAIESKLESALAYLQLN